MYKLPVAVRRERGPSKVTRLVVISGKVARHRGCSSGVELEGHIETVRWKRENIVSLIPRHDFSSFSLSLHRLDEDFGHARAEIVEASKIFPRRNTMDCEETACYGNFRARYLIYFSLLSL